MTKRELINYLESLDFGGDDILVLTSENHKLRYLYSEDIIFTTYRKLNNDELEECDHEIADVDAIFIGD